MLPDPDTVTYMAETDARGKRVKFGIKARDRERHVYVIGKTGMGKSTLLENMAIQDIQNGEGMAFIDPHGSSAEKLLDYVPEHRVKDVLYFAPFDMEHPVAFNVMEDVGYDKRHLVVSGLMSTFKKIWVDAWSARMEYILSNTLLALLEYPDATLLGVNRMLSDKVYREMVVNNVKDPAVKSFWVDEFAKYNERYMQEAGDAVKNKIGQFTANPLIRNIIGQPKSSFDVREIMDGRKIMIMNLSKGLVGETNANLLGSMLITRIYISAMSRADMSAGQLAKTPRFYFYVDEFQSFANEAFANILSEARKYKLNLTIAHQYIEQMEEEVRNAVFGNVGTTIAFRVGPFDAEVLETVFAPEFEATDIVNLGFAQVYMTLMIDGIGSRPFSAVTLPPIEPATISYKDMIIGSSRAQFAHTRGEIESNIGAWHAPIKKESTSSEKGAEKSVEKKKVESTSKVEVSAQPQQPLPAKQEAVARLQTPSAESAPTIFPQPSVEKPRVEEHLPTVQKVEGAYPKREQHPHTQLPRSRASSVERTPLHKQEKSLEDLRNTLRSITLPKDSKKEIVAPKVTVAKNDLKAALASVMASGALVLREEAFVPSQLHVIEKASISEKKVLPHNESNIVHTLVTEKKDDEMDNRKTVQKLERILRSGGNERPPLRS